jgi:hypothetical protein
VHTVDLFNHAKPFVNYASGDTIVMDGNRVVKISKPFEHIDGIDAEAVGKVLLPVCGFWQIVHRDGELTVTRKRLSIWLMNS